jgi:hypothetical protein
VKTKIILPLSLFALAACGNDAPPPSPAPPPAIAASVAPAPPVVQKAVATTPVEPRTDPNLELASRVKKALDAASSEISQGIDVTAVNGRVRLYGTVLSRDARRRAEKAAAATPGVSAVENKLVVVKGS